MFRINRFKPPPLKTKTKTKTTKQESSLAPSSEATFGYFITKILKKTKNKVV